MLPIILVTPSAPAPASYISGSTRLPLKIWDSIILTVKTMLQNIADINRHNIPLAEPSRGVSRRPYHLVTLVWACSYTHRPLLRGDERTPNVVSTFRRHWHQHLMYHLYLTISQSRTILDSRLGLYGLSHKKDETRVIELQESRGGSNWDQPNYIAD